jgi:hypothetical protein
VQQQQRQEQHQHQQHQQQQEEEEEAHQVCSKSSTYSSRHTTRSILQ